MSFLAPLFLAGLAAIGIPIIVHLTHRPKREAYPFPSLLFLTRVPFRSVRRQRIRHWWLLALRLAVIALVVAAFARPLLRGLGGMAGAFGSGREVVILLDDSYSMGYADRWTRALGAARRVVDGLGPDDRATIVLFGDRVAALGQATADHATLLAALAAAQPGFGATRYAGALQVARDILSQSDLPRQEVAFISDFQRAGWRAEDGVRLPPGTVIQPVNLSDPDAGNTAVTGLVVERGFRGQREEVTVSARVNHLGPGPIRGLRVALEADGRTVQTVGVNLEARGVAAATFSALPLSDRPLLVAARAEADQLAADNEQYAVLAPGDVLRVVLAAGGRAGGFLARALGVGRAPRFLTTARPTDGLRPADLERHSVAILADPTPGAAAAARLSAFVRRGGGLLVVLGGRSGAGGWGPGWTALLGGTPGATVDPPPASGGALAGLSYDHPVFEPFRAPHSGDFGSVRVYRYRRFDPAPGSHVLARYDDGGAALVEHLDGSGRVLVWTAGVDNVWSDLPVQPVFLPLVHQMVRYLASYRDRRTAFVVGQLLDLEGARAVLGGGSDLIVESPAGRRVALGPGGEPALTLEEPGFYTVRSLEGGMAPRAVAVNVDPLEGDLTPLDADAFLAAVGSGEEVASTASGGAAELGPAERERRQGLWWYLVMGAVVLALAETFLSNRLPALGRAGGSA